MRRRSLKKVLSGGRRTSIERNVGPKCHYYYDDEGKHEYIDPISLESIKDIPEQYVIRLKEHNHTFCFDIRTLHGWFQTGRRGNPKTNEEFSSANILKIKKKFLKLGLVLDEERIYINNEDITYVDQIISGGLTFYLTIFKPGRLGDRGIQIENFSNHFVNEEGETKERSYVLVIVPSSAIGKIFTKNEKAYNDLIHFWTNHFHRPPDDHNPISSRWEFGNE